MTWAAPESAQCLLSLLREEPGSEKEHRKAADDWDVERGVFFPRHPWGHGRVTSPKRHFPFFSGPKIPDAVLWGAGPATLGPSELRCFLCEDIGRGSVLF